MGLPSRCEVWGAGDGGIGRLSNLGVSRDIVLNGCAESRASGVRNSLTCPVDVVDGEAYDAYTLLTSYLEDDQNWLPEDGEPTVL